MKLYEYMAKEIFRREGIPVPPGKVCRSAREACGSRGCHHRAGAWDVPGEGGGAAGRRCSGGVAPPEVPELVGEVLGAVT